MFVAGLIAMGLVAAATASQVMATQQAATYNRQAAKEEARAAQQRARQEADRRRSEGRRRQARIAVRFAGQGVLADSGSAFDVMVDQAIQDEISAQQALDEGNLIAWQRNTERKRIGFQRDQSTVTTILSGAGAAAGAFTRTNRPRPAPVDTGPAPGSFRAAQETGL